MKLKTLFAGGHPERIATGFHRCSPTNVEAGSLPEETRAEQLIDRVNTTATIWLGTTLECAQCHDHKYDPITQRDFYSLFAFFNNVPEHGRALKVGNSPPSIPAPTPEQEQQEDQLRARVSSLQKVHQEAEPTLQIQQSASANALSEYAEITLVFSISR